MQEPIDGVSIKPNEGSCYGEMIRGQTRSPFTLRPSRGSDHTVLGHHGDSAAKEAQASSGVVGGDSHMLDAVNAPVRGTQRKDILDHNNCPGASNILHYHYIEPTIYHKDEARFCRCATERKQL